MVLVSTNKSLAPQIAYKTRHLHTRHHASPIQCFRAYNSHAKNYQAQPLTLPNFFFFFFVA